jgi:SAM-dependent methyltransferase
MVAVMRDRPRILGAVVAAPVEGARRSVSCAGCGSRLELGEWACADCRAEAAGEGFLRIGDAPLAAEGYDAELFDRLGALEETSFWFRGRNSVIAWALDRWFRGARSYLEAGCGTGYVLSAIVRARPGMEAVGAELFAEGLRLARSRLEGVPLVQVDVRSLDIEEAFDVVGMFDVLEHIDRDEDALRALLRALRPGGGLLVTVPQHPWLWSEADEYAGHVRRYTRRELTRRLRAAGFEFVWATSFVTLLLPFMAISRRLSRRHSYSLERELSLPRTVDRLFERSLDLERLLIARRFSLPVGGSLLVVARRPATRA